MMPREFNQWTKVWKSTGNQGRLIRLQAGLTMVYFSILFFAQCCLGKIPGGAPFSQLHKGDKQSHMDRPKLAKYKNKFKQQISGSNKFRPKRGGREDETDARAVRSDPLARCIE